MIRKIKKITKILHFKIKIKINNKKKKNKKKIALKVSYVRCRFIVLTIKRTCFVSCKKI